MALLMTGEKWVLKVEQCEYFRNPSWMASNLMVLAGRRVPMLHQSHLRRRLAKVLPAAPETMPGLPAAAYWVASPDSG